jgi:hypothetical protein
MPNGRIEQMEQGTVRLVAGEPMDHEISGQFDWPRRGRSVARRVDRCGGRDAGRPVTTPQADG